jgi:hypothetical protein
MKKSTKAALISAFVFPGVGHITLKRYIPGFILIAVSLTALYYLISKATENALRIVENIQSGNVPLDVTTITELVEKQSTGTESQLLNIATVTILLCWVIGIIDSYRVGLVQDKNKQSVNNKKT